MASIGNNFRCPKCTKTFAIRTTMEQHQRDAHVHQQNKLEESSHQVEDQEQYDCVICNKSFRNDGAIYNHKWHKHGVIQREKIYKCLVCPRSFVHREAVRQHTSAKHMNDNHPLAEESSEEKPGSLQLHLQNYLKTKTDVSKHETMLAFRYVNKKLQQILSSVRQQKGGDIFYNVLRKAGSNATGTKVYKADEFDFNIPVNIKIKQLIQKGTVPYTFQDKDEVKKKSISSSKNLTAERELVATGNSYSIPSEYTVVVVDTGFSQSMDGLCRGKHLIPHFLQQRLYSCIAKALEGETDVDLNIEAHGPAITMKFKPESGHPISVDITMVIDWPDITVSDYGWPRNQTREALSVTLIKKIQESGCQLTPKGDEFWNISFSNCESILMKEMDPPGECRKSCHMLLKTFFKYWQSRSKTGYNTISSFIFKHVAFWMNEKYHERGCWKNKHMSARFIDTLKELRTYLSSKNIPNYFNPEENILGIRDQEELKELSEDVGRTIVELENFSS